MSISRISWPEYAMALARTATVRCEDPYVQVGACCLGHDNAVLSLGYNGPPSGVEVDWRDRDQRRKRMLHAEVNCLKYVRPGDAKLLAVTHIPCLSCLAVIAAHKVQEVYYADDHLSVIDLDVRAIAKEFGINLIQLEEKVSIQKLSKNSPAPVAPYARA